MRPSQIWLKDYWFDGWIGLRYNKFRMYPRFAILLLLLFLCSGSACFGLTLRESIEICFKNNPEILAQGERIKEEESRVGQAFSAYLPTLRIEAQYGKTHQILALDNFFPGAVFSVLPDFNANMLYYGATFSQNIFSGGKLSNTLEMAQAKLEITKEELRKEKQELAFQVTTAFYNLLRAQRLLALEEEAIKIARAQLEHAENYANLGKSWRSDLLQAKVVLAQEEFSKVQLENDFQVARIHFNTVLGKKQAVDLTEGGGLNEPATALASSESLLAITLKKRPEWKIVEWQKKIREKEIDLARADFLPSVWLNGNTYKYKVDYADWSWRFETWVVYGLVSWNIFDGLKTPYRIREAQSGLAAAKFNEVELGNLIRSEIEEAQLRFDSEKQRIKLAEQEINLAQEHLTLAREEYRKGIKNNLELLEAQHTLSRAQADLLQAHSDYELAKAKINLVTGAEIFKPL